MAIRIGTRLFGKVETVGNQSIQTKFFIFGGPLFPLESYFCIETEGGGIKAIQIKAHLKSVLFGYLRTWGLGVGGIFAIMGLAQHKLELLIPAIPAILLGAISFKLGELNPEEKARRQVLMAVLGLAAPPHLLPPEMVETLRGRLDTFWQAVTPKALPGDWKNEVLAFTEKEKLPLLFSLAVYADDNLLAEKVWKLLKTAQAQEFSDIRPE